MNRGCGAFAGLRILVVEDEALIAIDLIDQLEELGATCVGPALTLAQALDLAQSTQVSCAVLDVRVGSDSIFPVAQLLRDKGTGFVFHTGDGDEASLQNEWPGCRVLKKPASSAEFIEAVTLVMTEGARQALHRG